jgi:hypothetical protein
LVRGLRRGNVEMVGFHTASVVDGL